MALNAQTNAANLFISVSSNVAIANVGDNVVFTINIKNNGPNAANNTRVTDVLPSGYTIVSASPSIGTWADPIWSVGALAVNATASISITVKVNPFGNYTNTVAIKADEPDPNLTDNSSKTTIGVIRAIDDYAYVNETFTGAVVNNILANDFSNGSFATLSKVNIEQISSSNSNINIDVNTGSVIVASSLPIGNYNLVYKITDKLNPALFSIANIFVNVNRFNGNIVDDPILALHDAGEAPEITGGIAVFNVLANDKLSGKPATLANVNLEFLASTDSRITLDLATGKVIVAPNTPGGPYILNYKITDKLDIRVTATSYVTVNVVGTGRLDTKDDAGIINGVTGGVAVANVLANDLNNGAVIQINDIFLSKLFSSNANIDLNVNTGEVTVSPGLPNGFYTLTYQVVDKTDINNKSAANAIIEVIGGVNTIEAKEDRGVVNGTTGGIAIQNILANDNLNGVVPTLADVDIFQTFSNNSAINLDFNTGQVLVNPGSYNGFYTVTYKIQQKTNPANVSIADIIVEIKGGLSLLTAKEDAGSASGIIGGVAVSNILANDDFAGNTPVLTDVYLTQIFSNNPGVSLDINTGQVIVAKGTENGVYTLAYFIEDKSNSENTSFADVIVKVTLDDLNILANPDVGSANGIIGGEAVANVLANDILAKNTPLITAVNLVQIFTSNMGVNLDLNTGKVIVNAGTPNGIYTLRYSIEDKANIGDISIAEVTITVNSGVSVIKANNDVGQVNRITGGIGVANVLLNDDLNGKIPLIAEVTITQLFTNHPNVNINVNTGQIIVGPGIPPDFYTVTYRIEDKINPSTFSIANATIDVSDAVSQILANNDEGKVILSGLAVVNILANDLYNGAVATTTNVTLEQVSTSNAGVNIDATNGRVNVTAGTPSGDYIIVYKIIDKLDNSRTSTASVKVNVKGILSPILAVNDAGTINGFTGGSAIANVLTNDTFNGVTALLADVTLTQITVNPNISISPTNGVLTVAPNTPAGVYTINYRITDKLNPTNFASADAVVTVTAPAISAVNDAGTINGFTGGSAIANVLTNDTFNGITASPTDVTLTQITVNPNISISPTNGVLTVAPNTPAGVYTINYRITDKLNPTNFASADAVVTVTAPAISAVNDAGTINGFTGGSAIANVLTNDTFNGITASPTDVTLTQITVNPNISISPTNGVLTVAPNTPAGVYTINYKITDKINPTNFAFADAVVTVTAPAISAVNDAGTINGFTGGSAIANVLTNDTFNGITASPTDVTLTQITVNPNISISPTNGVLTVAPNTPAGVYTINYKITDKINPTNFAFADAVVTVTGPAISAVNDAGTIDGFLGGTAITNILANDGFNGRTATIADVNISILISASTNVVLNPLNGEVNVASNTPIGLYAINYQITDKINPTNFSVAQITVTVAAPPIVASNDNGNIIGFNGGVAIANILENDKFNSLAATLSDVSITQITSNPNITINNSTGAVIVAPNTPANVYTIIYRITDKLRPSNFKEASVEIVVKDRSIIANNDTKTVDGLTTIIAIDNILANDLLNDLPISLANVNIINVGVSNPDIIINPLTGNVTVNAGILAGTYTIPYTIQDKTDLTFTAQANVIITITALPKIGVSKSVSIPQLQLDGSYLVTYNLNVQNYGNVTLTSVDVIDNLVQTFPLPVSFIVHGNINTTGSLVSNPLFNGRSNTSLLDAASFLAPNQKETISLNLMVSLNQTTESVFINKAIASGNSPGGVVTDESTDGDNPDSDANNNPTENDVTSLILNPVVIRIPQGFSPNNDGIHDKFVIQSTAGDQISLEIYNRWGNVVYKNENYKNEWGGESNQGITIGQELPDGTYFYIVNVNGKNKFVKSLTIKR